MYHISAHSRDDSAFQTFRARVCKSRVTFKSEIQERATFSISKSEWGSSQVYVVAAGCAYFIAWFRCSQFKWSRHNLQGCSEYTSWLLSSTLPEIRRWEQYNIGQNCFSIWNVDITPHRGIVFLLCGSHFQYAYTWKYRIHHTYGP